MSSSLVSAVRCSRRIHRVALRMGLLIPVCASLIMASAESSTGGSTLSTGVFSFEAGSAPFSVAIGDLNGDGKPDMAVANYSSRAVSVLLGRGDGRFAAKVDYETGGQTSWWGARRRRDRELFGTAG